MKIRRTLHVIIIIASTFCTFLGGSRAYAQPSGKITLQGQLTTRTGDPAQSFQVYLLPNSQDNSPTSPTATVKTDAEGRYLFRNLLPGEYVLYPYDNSAGFPMRGDMFLLKNPDRVTLKDADLDVVKNLVLHAETGTLRGKVTDEHGNPIRKATVVLCHSDEVWRSAEIQADDEGEFFYIVPSGEPLSVTASADHFGVAQKSGIVVKPLEQRSFTIVINTKLPQAKQIEGELCKPFRN